MAELIEERLPYTLKMSASAGTSFKNGTGESIVTPELYKGQKKITDATYRYYFGQEMTTGTTYKILASKITNTQVLTVAAYIDNNEVTRDELTFVNVNDGQNGVKGDKGERGEKGAIDEEKLKEIEQNINSKADNTLTQEQLNALNEKNSIMQAELEAKASLDTVNQWFKTYQDFVNSNAADKAKSEKALIAATQRVAKIENNLGDMAQRWNFIDTYMQATNEGLSIGKKDGSSFVRMGDNRISFYSAGKEVAYFSGGALQVDNGVFTKTLQIGRFREEQYRLNPDMNVIRYVGGA